MPTMRAKMVLNRVDRGQGVDQLTFSAVYGGENNKEDNSFSEATPSAELKMSVTNKSLLGQFEPGKKYYVDFTEAAD